MRDLFAIFPDLPAPRTRAAGNRVGELRRRLLNIRTRAKANAVRQKQAAAVARRRRGRPA